MTKEITTAELVRPKSSAVFQVLEPDPHWTYQRCLVTDPGAKVTYLGRPLVFLRAILSQQESNDGGIVSRQTLQFTVPEDDEAKIEVRVPDATGHHGKGGVLEHDLSLHQLLVACDEEEPIRVGDADYRIFADSIGEITAIGIAT